MENSEMFRLLLEVRLGREYVGFWNLADWAFFLVGFVFVYVSQNAASNDLSSRLGIASARCRATV